MTIIPADGISRRFKELIAEGHQLFNDIQGHSHVLTEYRPQCVSWLLSAVNLLEVATPTGSRYRTEAQRLLPKSDATIFLDCVASILGILKSAAAECSRGPINSLEFQFVGLAFEQFLKHASQYNESGKKMEAAVLASAVLEDTVKRLCRKHNIAVDGKTLDSLINALKAGGVVNRVKSERLKSYASLRNQAFHAEWNGFDDRDLRQMIEGLEELIETHFESANADQ